LHAHEFTSHCPVTGQPDYAELTFVYQPDAYIVETKSFKLWLQRWRDRKAFNEQIVHDLAIDFAAQVRPRSVRVKGVFSRRGGIHVETEALVEQQP